jgi:hypothetical protein
MSKSVVTVKRSFCAKYAKDPPTGDTIRVCYKQFTETEKVKNIDAPMLPHVWQEREYRIDVCHVTRGAHIEHLLLSPTPPPPQNVQFSCGCEQFH